MTNMQNTYTEPTDKKGRQGQWMLPTHINVSSLVFFPLLNNALYLYTGTSFIHIMLIFNPNDSAANWIPCRGWNGSMK